MHLVVSEELPGLNEAPGDAEEGEGDGGDVVHGGDGIQRQASALQQDLDLQQQQQRSFKGMPSPSSEL